VFMKFCANVVASLCGIYQFYAKCGGNRKPKPVEGPEIVSLRLPCHWHNIDLVRNIMHFYPYCLKAVLPYEDDFCCNKHTFGKLVCTRYKRHDIVVNEFVKFLCLWHYYCVFLVCFSVFSVHVCLSVCLLFTALYCLPGMANDYKPI